MFAVNSCTQGCVAMLGVCLAMQTLATPDPAAGLANPPKVESRREVAIYSTRGDNRLHIVDATDLAIVRSIDVGLGAHELAISPDGRWAVGSAYGGPGAGHQPADDRLVVVDLSTLKVHRVVAIGAQRPNDLVFLPPRSGRPTEVLATVESPPRLARVNVETGAVSLLELTDKAGHMLALAPGGSTAIVAHVAPGSLTFIDVPAWKVSGRLDKVPFGAEGIAISPDGERAWVASNRSDTISIISVGERAIIRQFACTGFPFRVRFSPGGEKVAVSCPGAGEVAIFDGRNPETVDRVSVGPARPAPLMPGGALKVVPTSIAFSANGGSILVVCDGATPELVRIDVATKSVTARAPAKGPIPDALAVGTIETRPG